jgi:hypothetical protein
MLALKKPEKFPMCGEADILRILYGQPVAEKAAMVKRGGAGWLCHRSRRDVGLALPHLWP